MEVSVGTNYYGEDLASDLFDQIDDLLEFPNDDELLIEMVGPSVSANESLEPIIAPSGGSSVEETFDTMLLPIMEDHSFLVDTRRDSCNGSGLINTGDISSVEEDHLGHCDELEMTQLEWLANFFDEPASASSLPLENHVSVPITTKTPTVPTSIKCPTTINPTPTLSIPVPVPVPSDIIIKDEPSLLFCTSSPVSVLEQTSFSNGDSSGNSGNNSSGGSSATSSLSSTSYFSSNNFSRASLSPRAVAPPEPNFVIPARRRSKRPRPASFSPNRLITTPSLPPSLDIKPIIETMAESEPIPTPISVPVSVSVYELPTQIKKKKKTGPKKSSFIESGDEDAEWGQVQVNETGVRRCMHCQIEKTPQWRAGPMGPKTLCNACGVRYKSGRLFPEYRPAASPTFVPAIHSNSHKKVVEMRLKTTDTVRPRGSGLLGMIRKRE